MQVLRGAPVFPNVGETIGEFRLLAELGRGTLGRVFLAVQSSLADRPVVLKLTPCDGREHLSLARLQHTHIVPLYSVQDHAEWNLRVLCMPYLGCASFARILDLLHHQPLEKRTGQHLLDALDQVQAALPLAAPSPGSVRRLLARFSYAQAVCWMGICLADALHYAHERGLVHLDLKPSNVLLAADGLPMLLDFNLAREPIQPDSPAPEWLGGTHNYMSPEQRLAEIAVLVGGVVPEVVDGRSDVYSLGLVLYEALGGILPTDAEKRPPSLHGHHPQVTVGLADILGKCLEHDLSRRYRDAAALATDLRRHLGDLPLHSVPNRSVRERWRKWRRRRPYALVLAGMVSLILAGIVIAGAAVLAHVGQRLHDAESLLSESQEQLRRHEYSAAERTSKRGLALLEHIPGSRDRMRAFRTQIHLANRAQIARDLHELTDQIRFLYLAQALPPKEMRALQARCGVLWKSRTQILDPLGVKLEPDVEQRIQVDLLDLAILGADLRVRLAARDEVARARQDGLRVLMEAKATFGPNPILDRELKTYTQALGLPESVHAAARRTSAPAPETAWEHYALGRSLLRSGSPSDAAKEFDRALQLQPQNFWANFYQGICAYALQQPQDALKALSICVALAPETAECFYNRALAYSALRQPERALQDYTRALELNPNLAAAALNRGVIFFRMQRYRDAKADFLRALDKGADPATVRSNLSVLSHAQQDRAAALASLGRAQQLNPGRPGGARSPRVRRPNER